MCYNSVQPCTCLSKEPIYLNTCAACLSSCQIVEGLEQNTRSWQSMLMDDGQTDGQRDDGIHYCINTRHPPLHPITWARLWLHHSEIRCISADIVFQKLSSCTTKWPHSRSIFIQIDAHALTDAHTLHHQALGTKQYVKSVIFYQKCMGLRSIFEPMIIHRLHVLLMLNAALLLEWIRYELKYWNKCSNIVLQQYTITSPWFYFGSMIFHQSWWIQRWCLFLKWPALLAVRATSRI